MNLINDDCLNALTNIPDNSVNLVIADLPYGQTNCKWDIKIDLAKMWEHFKRVGTNNCAYIFFTTTKFGIDLIQSNKEWFRYDLVWTKDKPVGFLNAKRMPMRSHEMIYVFYNKLPTYNIEGNHELTKQHSQNDGFIEGCYGAKRRYKTEYTPRLPTSILNFKIINNVKKRFHPTEKPVDLLEWIIKYYSNEGDTILDPTMGSGSTGIACINMKRNFIGIEMDKHIFDVAKNRIDDVTKTPT
jgi:site-specific DNA-methyltransferase (adenine-specific)